MTNTTLIIIACVVIALAIFAIGLAAGEDAKERAEWQSFVDLNDCHIAEVEDSQTASSMGPGIGFDGKLTMIQQTVYHPARECWLCANGVRYWKKAGMAVDRSKAGPV